MEEPKEIQRWMCKRCGEITHTELNLHPEPGECKRSNRNQLPPHNWVKNGQISREEYQEYLIEKEAEHEAYMKQKAEMERKQKKAENIGCFLVLLIIAVIFILVMLHG